MGYHEKRGVYSYRLNVQIGVKKNGRPDYERRTIQVDHTLINAPSKLKKHLDMELAKFQMEVEAGHQIKPGKMTFEAFVPLWEDNWANIKIKEGKFSPVTLDVYNDHLHNHILPVFGHMRIEQIQTFHAVKFFKSLTEDGARKDGKSGPLSGSTREYIYRILKNIFTRMVEWKLIVENPIIGVDKPTPDEREELYYEEDEARIVLDALYKEPVKWRLFFMGSMFGGFRRGELVALQWSNVDFIKGGFHIKKNIPSTKNGQALVKEPKTKKSKGFVKMPVWYMKEIERFRVQWLQEKDGIGDNWLGEKDEYVFHGGFGKPFYHTTPTKVWRKFIERHNLKYIRLHDLRHTTATLLIEKYLQDGVDAELALKAIQEHLRHSRFQTTLDRYGHITKKVSDGVAQKFDSFNPSTSNKILPIHSQLTQKRKKANF